MATFVQDLKYAFRTHRKHWTVTVAAVLSLALAIGGNTAVFSMVDVFIFQPLPFEQPERLVLFGERTKDTPEGQGGLGTSLPTWADLQDRTRTLSGWAAIQSQTLSLRGDDGSEPLSAQRVTPGFFGLIGAQAARGRVFLPEEGVEGARRVVLISEELRAERWPDDYPLGEVMVLNSEPHEIVGIMPPGFAFLATSEIWVPLTRSPYAAPRDQRNTLALARMAPQATMEQIRTEVRRIAETLEGEHPEIMGNRTFDALNMRYDLPRPQTKLLFGIFQGTVGLVLLIACVNITNLLLARGQGRSREMALRTVLGASRRRIVQQLLTESLAMGIMGGALGLALGKAGISWIARTWAGQIPAFFTPALDQRALLFTLGTALGASVLFGMAPALQTVKKDHSSALREGHGRGGGGGGRKRLSRMLVVGEIALSMVALGVGAMLVRSFLEIRSSAPGFDGEDVLVATLAVPPSRYPEELEQRVLTDRILERIENLPGVSAAAVANAVPQAPFRGADSLRIPGQEPPDGTPLPEALRVVVSPAYLEVMDIELLQGRFFQEQDREDGLPVAVVDRALVERHFQGKDPLGARLVLGGEELQVVGVVSNVQQSLIAAPGSTSETVYLPQAQNPAPVALLLEATGDPHELAGPLRAAVQEVDVDLTLRTVLTMEEFVDQFFIGIRVFNVILGSFGIMALFMAALGTYGVLSYSVSQRRHEIGVRLALGAGAGKVVGMISRQGLVLGAVGLALGLMGTYPLIGSLRAVTSTFTTVRPSTLGIIAAVLAGVTALASWFPARQAARVDPVDSLRDE